jgi:DNA-binding transcriptional regulator YiaG
MISLEIPAFSATSASGAMLIRQVREPVIIGCMLAGLGTSTVHEVPTVLVSQCPAKQTTAGVSVSMPVPAGVAIGELRRLSGLTWEQLSRLFNVSRRSLHFWASGKPMAPSNEEHLQRLLAVIRRIDRGSASANRAALLGVREDGSIPYDLLAAGQYARVFSLLGPGDAERGRPPRPSAEMLAVRAPPPPEELVGALQGSIHRNGGRVRAARSVRVRSGR